MLLKNKKGNLVLQFVILVIIAGIMILVVTTFGAKIWHAIFGNEDKSSLKSFETLYSVINAKSVSQADYDSTYTTLYMAKNYRVVLFNSESEACVKESIIAVGGGHTQTGTTNILYYAPKECDPKKQCLCLYDDEPESGEKNKNKNVITCHIIQNKIEVNYSRFELNKHVCDRTTFPEYTSYIIIQRKEGTNDDSRRLYIITDTEDNRKLDAGWSVPICPGGTDEICYGIGQGKKIAPTDENRLQKLYDICQTQNYKSISGTCVYDITTKTCKINCDNITATCQQYSTCDSLNTNGNALTYISNETNHVNYKLCTEHYRYCGVDCEIAHTETYIFKNSVNGEYITGVLEPAPAGCFYYLDYNQNPGSQFNYQTIYTNFVTYYNVSDIKCEEYFNNYFYPEKHQIYVCKKDNDACKQYIDANINYCDLKYFNEGDINFITYFNTQNTQCQTEIENLFEVLSYCAIPLDYI